MFFVVVFLEQIYIFPSQYGSVFSQPADLLGASEDGRGAGWAAVARGHACRRRVRSLQRLQQLRTQHREPGVTAEERHTDSDTLTDAAPTGEPNDKTWLGPPGNLTSCYPAPDNHKDLKWRAYC